MSFLELVSLFVALYATSKKLHNNKQENNSVNFAKMLHLWNKLIFSRKAAPQETIVSVQSWFSSIQVNKVVKNVEYYLMARFHIQGLD